MAGLSFFPLPETKRCLEPLLKFHLLHSFGAYRQVVNFNEDQSRFHRERNARTDRVPAETFDILA